VSKLYSTLHSRHRHAPQGSYTKKLFDDPKLLGAKIREEADELCEASTKDDVTWEAADLIYFALAKCVQLGVSFADVERQLDAKSKKLSRRPGLAKPKYVDSKPEKLAESRQLVSGPLEASIDPHQKYRMRTLTSSSLSSQQRKDLLSRPILNADDITSKVLPIMQAVRSRGDVAVLELTAKFDGVTLKSPVMRAPFPENLKRIESNVKAAIDQAFANIEKFHSAQLDRQDLVVETMPGVVCSRFSRPIQRVGLYVPGGTAVLPSTALMLGIPASVAGCEQIIIATPPRKDGSISPEVLYVAEKVGASMVVLAGGAQAVAAMAYGTESVPKVDKICGPGNQFVTAAKMIAQNDSTCQISIDMPAGPSELLVIADKFCNPSFVVSDLLSQAEHGPDSQVVLVGVALDSSVILKVQLELESQAQLLPRRDIIGQCIPKSFILLVNSLEEALDFSNDYAPEHLILHIQNARNALAMVKNAGSVFVGEYSPER
jgi:phosphoribosyl-ATP pyrophosphohydrolase/phosphoribosyl-AMP cyclohydrolase/histidinol dehydrogenase